MGRNGAGDMLADCRLCRTFACPMSSNRFRPITKKKKKKKKKKNDRWCPKEAVFTGDVRAIVRPSDGHHRDNDKKAAEDTATFLDYLETRRDVAGSRIGALVFAWWRYGDIRAATYPDRFAAVASFHAAISQSMRRPVLTCSRLGCRRRST
jgi:hypothetical protein